MFRFFSFPVYTKPYLACLHSSHITTSTHITNCPDDLWTHLIQAGEEQSGADTTSKVIAMCFCCFCFIVKVCKVGQKWVKKTGKNVCLKI